MYDKLDKIAVLSIIAESICLISKPCNEYGNT